MKRLKTKANFGKCRFDRSVYETLLPYFPADSVVSDIPQDEEAKNPLYCVQFPDGSFKDVAAALVAQGFVETEDDLMTATFYVRGDLIVSLESYYDGDDDTAIFLIEQV